MRSTTDQYDIGGILTEMRDDYRRAIEEGEEETTTTTRDFVIFALNSELYGIESRFAREVLRLPRFVPVPRLPAHYIGIFNLRGQIHAITDLRPLFRLQQQPVAPRTKVIVTEASGLSTAICTDGVHGISSVPVDSIEPIQGDLQGLGNEVISGRVQLNGRPVLLIDVERLFDRPELVVEIFSGEN